MTEMSLAVMKSRADTEEASCVSGRYFSGGQAPGGQLTCLEDAFRAGRHRRSKLRVRQMLFGRADTEGAVCVSGMRGRTGCGVGGGGPEFSPAGVFLRGGERRRAEIEFF